MQELPKPRRAATPGNPVKTLGVQQPLPFRPPSRSLFAFQKTKDWERQALYQPTNVEQLLQQRQDLRRNVVSTIANDVKDNLSATSGFAATFRKPLPESALQLVPAREPSGYINTSAISLAPSAMDGPHPTLLPSLVQRNLNAGAERRMMYFQWVQSFELEKQKFKSINVWAEVVLTQVMDATRDDPLPSPLRTAVCAYVLERLVSQQDRSGLPPIMSILKVELLNAIYPSHQVNLAKALGNELAERHSSQNEQPRGRTPANENRSLSLIPKQSSFDEEPSIPSFIDFRMYAEDCRSLRGNRIHSHKAALERESTEMATGKKSGTPSPRQVVAIAHGDMRATHRTLKGLVFRAWRFYVAKHRKATATDLAGLWVKLNLQNNSAGLLQKSFRKWKAFPAERRSKNENAKLQHDLTLLRSEIEAKSQLIADLRTQLKKENSKSAAAKKSKRPGASIEEYDLSVSDSEVVVPPLVESQKSPVVSAYRAEQAPSIRAMPQEHYHAVTAVDRNGSEDAPFAGVEKANPEKVLLFWANKMIEVSAFKSMKLEVVNVESSFVDGKAYLAVLHVLFPVHTTEDSINLPHVKRVEFIMNVLDHVGLPSNFIDATDIINGSAANYGLLNWLYQRWYHQSLRTIDLMELGAASKTQDPCSRVADELSHEYHIVRLAPEVFHVLSQRINTFAQNALLEKIRQQRPQTVNVLADLVDFTSIDPAWLVEVEADLNTVKEAALCGSVMRQRYTEIKRVFDFYRGVAGTPASPTGSSMLAKGFWRLMEDTKLMARCNLNRQWICQQLTGVEGGEMIRQPSKSGIPALTQGNPEVPAVEFASVSKKKFVLLLCRIALFVALGRGYVRESGQVATTLEEVISQQILPRAITDAKAEFLRMYNDQKVQDVLAQPAISKCIGKVFRHFAAPDAVGHPMMSRKQFITLVQNLSLLDKSLKDKDLEQIFTDCSSLDDEVQSPTNPNLNPNPESASVTQDGVLMSIGEFQEALFAVALFKFPLPMQPPFLRLQRFCLQSLLPQSAQVLFSK